MVMKSEYEVIYLSAFVTLVQAANQYLQAKMIK